jgi:hypothetical protein
MKLQRIYHRLNIYAFTYNTATAWQLYITCWKDSLSSKHSLQMARSLNPVYVYGTEEYSAPFEDPYGCMVLMNVLNTETMNCSRSITNTVNVLFTISRASKSS